MKIPKVTSTISLFPKFCSFVTTISGDYAYQTALKDVFKDNFYIGVALVYEPIEFRASCLYSSKKD